MYPKIVHFICRSFSFTCIFAYSLSADSAVFPAEKLFSNCAKVAAASFPNIYDNLTYILHRPANSADTTHLMKTLLTEIAKNSNQTVIISTKVLHSLRELHFIYPSGYIIPVPSCEHLKETLSGLNVSHINWRPGSRFLILFTKNTNLHKRKITISKEISKILNAFNIYDFLILIGNQTLVSAFTRFPFDSNNNCGSKHNMRLLDQCTEKGFLRNKNLFPRKVPQQFSGCVFRAAGFDWPPYVYENDESKEFTFGFSVVTMEALARKHNFTLQYLRVEEGSRWGQLLDNGTWTGALGWLQAGRADVNMGGSLLTIMRINKFDFSPTYNSLFMKFYLPLPLKLPHWKNMINIFSPMLWITIWVMYVATSIFICIVAKLNTSKEKYHYQHLSECFLTMWKITVGSCADSIPRSREVRIILLLWLIYNFHITSVYTSSLLGFITKPAFGEPMRSIEELSKSNLRIKVVKQFLQILSMMDDEYKEIVFKKLDTDIDPFRVQENSDLDRMIAKRDIAILDTADHFETFAKDYVSKTYTLEDNVRLNPCMYVPKGSPFLKLLNDIQLTVRENGQYQKIESDIKYSNKYESPSKSYENEIQITALTLQELSGSFYVLLFGLLLSILVFIIEVFTFRFQIC